jgi:hypothetical protein
MLISRYDTLVARLASKQAQLVALNAAVLRAESKEIASFELDTGLGEAKQRVTYRNLESMMLAVDRLEKEIDHISRTLNGRAFVRILTNRRG